MSEEKMRASFEECVKETECMLMVDEDTAFDIFRYAYKAALQESEAGAVGYVTNDEIVEHRRAQLYPSANVMAGQLLYLAPPSAQAIETAAIMKCVETCSNDESGRDGGGYFADLLEALIPQDGRTQLEEFGMKVADKVSQCIIENLHKNGVDDEMLHAIVTNLIGEKR